MQYTNSEILASVLNKYIQPVIVQLAQMKMGSFPLVQAFENKVRSSGWVSPNWSLAKELSPFVEPMTESLVKPMIQHYLNNIPDEAIPNMAHSIVDKAIADGSFSFLEGKLLFEKADLEELKKLLNYNLPLTKVEEYQVLTSPKAEQVTDGTETSTNA